MTQRTPARPNDSNTDRWPPALSGIADRRAPSPPMHPILNPFEWPGMWARSAQVNIAAGLELWRMLTG